ncbi:MAG: FAD-binding oxidoreductase, partial [Desulfobacteraceae bacterium]|nr:FAD-binding oxidoreductase [Desulfobacteraceae bacterium]
MKKKSKDTDLAPKWLETAPRENSFRSIFKWGDKYAFKNPSKGFLQVIKEGLNLTDTDFTTMENTGNQPIKDSLPMNLSRDILAGLEKIVGKENLSIASYDRLKYAKGKAMEDILNLRLGKVKDVCDVVVHPRHKEDV